MYKIGIDVGGMSIKAGLVVNGEIIQRSVKETNQSGGLENIIEDITELVNDLLDKSELEINNIDSSKDFYFYIFKEISSKTVISLPLELRSIYTIMGNDGNEEDWIQLSSNIFWNNDNRTKFLKERWLPKNSCWTISQKYFEKLEGTDISKFKEFFTSNCYFSDFSEQNFFKYCTYHCSFTDSPRFLN